MLDEARLLELIAEDRKRREAAASPVDLDLTGGLTFQRARQLALDPSSITEDERKLLNSSHRAARLVEHFRSVLQEECEDAAASGCAGAAAAPEVAPAVAVPPPRSVPEVSAPAQPRIVILLAAPRRQARAGFVHTRGDVMAYPTEPDVWDVQTSDGSRDIPLPPDVAQRCYGHDEQTVTLSLHRVASADDPDLYEPQLEVTPTPTHGSLTFLLTFANGEQHALTVLPLPEGCQSAWSERCDDLLPEDAFGPDPWQLSVEMRQHAAGRAPWPGFVSPFGFPSHSSPVALSN